MENSSSSFEVVDQTTLSQVLEGLYARKVSVDDAFTLINEYIVSQREDEFDKGLNAGYEAFKDEHRTYRDYF